MTVYLCAANFDLSSRKRKLLTIVWIDVLQQVMLLQKPIPQVFVRDFTSQKLMFDVLVVIPMNAAGILGRSIAYKR